MQNSILVDYHQVLRNCNDMGLEVKTVMEEIYEMGLKRGEISELRLFVPTYSDTRLWHQINELEIKFGAEISACPVLVEETLTGTSMKDAVDAKVLIWVKTHLHKGVVPNLIIYVSGDSDFIIISNEAKKKGKKIEFWSVSPSSISKIIKRQENFSPIKVPVLIENPFIVTIGKVMEHNELNQDDKRRLEMIMALKGIQLRNGSYRTAKEAIEESAKKISSQLKLALEDSRQLLEALIMLESATVRPAISNVVEIDESSSIFQLLPNVITG